MSSVNAKYTEHVMRGAKPMNTILRKDEKAMVQIKRDWFDTAFGKLRKEKNVWQMEREDTSLTGKIIRCL